MGTLQLIYEFGKVKIWRFIKLKEKYKRLLNAQAF